MCCGSEKKQMKPPVRQMNDETVRKRVSRLGGSMTQTEEWPLSLWKHGLREVENMSPTQDRKSKEDSRKIVPSLVVGTEVIPQWVAREEKFSLHRGKAE